MTNVTCGLTAKKPGWAPCPTLVVEYGTTLLYSVSKGIVKITFVHEPLTTLLKTARDSCSSKLSSSSSSSSSIVVGVAVVVIGAGGANIAVLIKSRISPCQTRVVAYRRNPWRHLYSFRSRDKSIQIQFNSHLLRHLLQLLRSCNIKIFVEWESTLIR